MYKYIYIFIYLFYYIHTYAIFNVGRIESVFNQIHLQERWISFAGKQVLGGH